MVTCFFFNQVLQAQAKFYTVVSEATVSFRQTFQVQYIIEGAKEIKQFRAPAFRDFRIEEEFEMQNSTSTNQQNTVGYMKVFVLSPKRSGQFAIPPAMAVIDGKSMQSNSVRVRVNQSKTSPSNNLNSLLEDIDTEIESELHPGEDISEKIRKNFFLKVDASKTNCYVGEPLMVVYKAYSRLNANSQVVKRPSLTGFSVLEMVDSYDGKPEIEKLNGILYYSNIIRKVQLFPLQEGNFVLDPAEIESMIRFVKTGGAPNRKNNVAPSRPSVIQYRTILRTDPLTITVKPLPQANQPENYRGAVGNYTLDLQVPREPIRQGDLVKIQLMISGTGNLSLLTAPEIEWPAGVDTADPVVTENFNKYAFPLSGTKVFEYSFAAPDTGDYIIPAVEFPYYDPANKEYKKAVTGPVTLHVLANTSKDDLKKKLEALDKKNNTGIPRHLYWFGLVVLLITGSIIYQAFFVRKKKAIVEQPTVTTSDEMKSKPGAAELLSAAGLALQQGKNELFYHEVQEALWKVIAEKCAVLPSALNKENVKDRLAVRGVKPAVIQNLVFLLDECEWALYTPDQASHDMEQLLTNAEGVLQQLLEV